MILREETQCDKLTSREVWNEWVKRGMGKSGEDEMNEENVR